MSKLEWNGTFIEGKVVGETGDGTIKVFQIDVGDNEIINAIVAPYNPLSVIADELKPYFGLEKTGTHLIKIKSRVRLLYRMTSSFDEPILSYIDLENKGKYLHSIQKLLVYRDIFGVNPNTVNGIRIRSGSFAVSYNDKFGINVKSNKVNIGVMSQTTLKRWFDDEITTPDDVFRHMMLMKYNRIDIDLANYLRAATESVINRIDSSHMWFSNHVYSSILRRLSI